VLGDTVNVASRACGLAKGGQILLTESLKEHLREQHDSPHVELRDAGESQVKGKGKMRFFALEKADDIDQLLDAKVLETK
jgi:class 3 adenylate cyclase